MRAAHARLVFALAARLQVSAAGLEALSAREVGGWITHFNAQADADDDGVDDGAIDLATLDRGTLRAMFHR